VTDDDKKPSDSQSSIPVEVPRRNVDKMQRPAEFQRQASPPIEDVKDPPETQPIVMASDLPKSPDAEPATDDKPVRPETTTIPFELLPPRQSATPATGIPKAGADDEPSTKPLEMPLRPPASTKPVMVEMTEQKTGTLTVTDDSRVPEPKPRISREISAAVDGLIDTEPPQKPITVELVEENSGVLSAADPSSSGPVGVVEMADPPANPLSAAAQKLAAEKTAKEKETGSDTAGADKPTDKPETTPADKPTDKPADKLKTTPADKPTDKLETTPADKLETEPADKPTNKPADKTADKPEAKAATAVDADDVDEESVVVADDKSGPEMVPWVAPGDDGFLLANEIGNAPPPLVPNPPILPSPQEAALEAARIVSQMVDIESESGAVIAAAAAAGAAIEAAKAAHKATLDPRASQPNMRVTDLAAAGAQSHDPITTVRLSRDRILAALADEDIAVPVPPTAREPQARTGRAKTDPGRVRARTEPGVEEEVYEDFDPVAIAAAAIGRLRARARTDLAELRVHYHRHDILVLLIALVIIIVAGRVHEQLVTPPTQQVTEEVSERGLVFEHPRTWLRPEPVPPIAPRIVRDPTGAPPKTANLYHVEFSAVGSTAKLEVMIDKKPTWSNIVTGLELDRRSRWGELYTLDASSVRSIAGHDWLRTGFRYAHTPDKGDVPRIDQAVEFATIDREQIYVITIFGTKLEIEQIEGVIAPSLRVPSQTGLPLVPQTSRLSQRKYPTPVGRAFDSTVMVVVADLVDGRLKARGGGSGVIVGGEGSILTNYHVIHDKDGRLHDVFIVGRFSAPDRAPQLQCAGRPSRSKLQRELDLALIKCDMDLDGRAWSPTGSGIWATLPEARVVDVKIGQRLWVLGYPDVGGGGLQLGHAEVEGWTGEEAPQGKDFIKTNGSITHGNSGGPVIDDNGRLVGIAAAFRTRITANGGVIEMAQVGLVRPLQTASNLLAYAAAGWTPREGYTDVELTPSAIEASTEGVRIYTQVIDDANEQPVRDATVMVLKSGVNTSTIDMNRLDDQAIAWGKTNAQGEVRLKQLVPVPGTYTVMVVAPGYEPLIGENELRLDANTPPRFDPWTKIGLRSR
jgi:S1-C subfamily serine protease